MYCSGYLLVPASILVPRLQIPASPLDYQFLVRNLQWLPIDRRYRQMLDSGETLALSVCEHVWMSTVRHHHLLDRNQEHDVEDLLRVVTMRQI